MVQGMERAVPDVFDVFALGKFSDFCSIIFEFVRRGEVTMLGMEMLFEGVKVSNEIIINKSYGQVFYF